MHRARRMMREQGRRQGVRVTALAAELGVPERTLYQAFRRHLGVGPSELDRIERMHTYRTSLLHGPYVRGKIAALGREVGYADPTSLVRTYRRCFGESPRETQRRRRAAPVI